MNQPSRSPASPVRGVSAQLDRFVHARLPPPEQWPDLHYNLPELQFPPQLNLVEELLDKAPAKGFGQRPLLRSSRVTFSYEEVAERVNRIAQWLTEDMGLVSGNRVLLRGGNSVGMALCWLAVVKAGMVAVATMPLLRARELGDIIDKAQPALALCDATLLAELKYAQQEHPALRTIQKFNAADDPADLGALCAGKSGVFAPCPTAADDIALMAFTSGTTGGSKAVRCSQGRLARIGYTAVAKYGHVREDVDYCCMSLFHGNAIMALWAPALAVGVSPVTNTGRLRNTMVCMAIMPLSLVGP